MVCGTKKEGYNISNTCKLDDILVFAIPVAMSIGMGVLVVSVIYAANAKKRSSLKKLSGALNGSLSKSLFTPAFSGESQGLKFLIELVPGGKNSPDYLKISILKNSFFRLSIYKETFFSELGKRLGIVHEIKTGDETFDKEFLIFCNKPNQGITYFGNSQIKNAIRELFNFGFTSIITDGKKIIIQKPNYNLEADVNPSRIVTILQKSSLLASGL